MKPQTSLILISLPTIVCIAGGCTNPAVAYESITIRIRLDDWGDSTGDPEQLNELKVEIEQGVEAGWDERTCPELPSSVVLESLSMNVIRPGGWTEEDGVGGYCAKPQFVLPLEALDKIGTDSPRFTVSGNGSPSVQFEVPGLLEPWALVPAPEPIRSGSPVRFTLPNSIEPSAFNVIHDDFSFGVDLDDDPFVLEYLVPETQKSISVHAIADLEPQQTAGPTTDRIEAVKVLVRSFDVER